MRVVNNVGHKNSTLANGVKVTPFGVMSVLFQHSSSYGAFNPRPSRCGCRVGRRGSILGLSPRKCLTGATYLYESVLRSLSMRIHTFSIVHSSIGLHFNKCKLLYSYK